MRRLFTLALLAVILIGLAVGISPVNAAPSPALSITRTTATTVSLRWAPGAASANFLVARYSILRGWEFVSPWQGPRVRTFTDRAVPPGAYDYAVYAIYQDGSGAWSNYAHADLVSPSQEPTWTATATPTPTATSTMASSTTTSTPTTAPIDTTTPTETPAPGATSTMPATPTTAPPPATATTGTSSRAIGALFADTPGFDAALPTLKAALGVGLQLRIAGCHQPQGTAKCDAMLSQLPGREVIWNLDPGTTYPKDPGAFGAYCGQFASRWPGLRWTILNEPRGTLGTSATVIGLVNACADAIHASDPSAQAIGPELQAGQLAQSFGADVLRGTYQHLDAVSIHVIPSTAVRSQVLQQAADAYATARSIIGPDKPLYLTEVGYSSDPAYQEPLYTGGEDGQARWARDTIPTLRQQGWGLVVWALLTDGAPYAPGKPYGANGLVGDPSNGYRVKPSWDSFRQAA